MAHASRRFTPQAVEAMNRAYDAVCDVLRRESASHPARVKAGEVIMRLAQQGELDEDRLREAALSAASHVRTGKREGAA